MPWGAGASAPAISPLYSGHTRQRGRGGRHLPTVRRAIGRLRKAVEPYSRVLILTHNNPDPDALASAVGLRQLIAERIGKPVVVGYAGFLSRAENKEMVRRLRLRVRNISHMDLRRFRAVILVDTQPGTGNSPLSARHRVVGVVDHHPLRDTSRGSVFGAIDPDAGATSTIVYELLKAAGVKPAPNVATALFFGIKTDTQDLGREATERDQAAYKELFGQAQHKKLAQIVHPRVSIDYYRTVDVALRAAKKFGDCVYVPVGPVATPEHISEIADYIVNLEGIRWAVVTGEFKGDLYFSIRTLSARKDAGRTLRKAMGDLGFAGGHHKMAGGMLPLGGLDDEKRTAASQRVLTGLFAALGANTSSPEPLLTPGVMPSSA